MTVTGGDSLQRTASEKICAEEYVVQRGDSFYLISHKLGVPLRDLLAANADIHPARLMVGDVLCVPREEDDSPQTPAETPDTSAPAADSPECEQVTLMGGQTVADVLIEKRISMNTLANANPNVDIGSVSAGQTLCVPRVNLPCSLPATYTLTEGETLESVAVRFNLPIASLLRANPCLAPQDFEQGTVVILPK